MQTDKALTLDGYGKEVNLTKLQKSFGDYYEARDKEGKFFHGFSYRAAFVSNELNSFYG